MKAIKVTQVNADAIVAALKTVNGKAERHAFTTYPEVEDLGLTAERRLEKALIKKAERKGARLVAVSGDSVSNAYAKKGGTRAATQIILERRSTGWFITDIKADSVYQSGGGLRLVLTQAQKDVAVARFSATLYTV